MWRECKFGADRTCLDWLESSPILSQRSVKVSSFSFIPSVQGVKRCQNGTFMCCYYSCYHFLKGYDLQRTLRQLLTLVLTIPFSIQALCSSFQVQFQFLLEIRFWFNRFACFYLHSLVEKPERMPKQRPKQFHVHTELVSR